MQTPYIILVYNPKSGSKDFPPLIDFFLECYQNKGVDIRIFRLDKALDAYLDRQDVQSCKGIFIAGGDGSVNGIVTYLMTRDLDIPIGIIPAGTSNDFATFLGISDNFAEAIEDLSAMNSRYVDVGKVNDQYFINVCSGGFITNVAHNIDADFKYSLGKLAYFLKGFSQVPKFKPIRFRIETQTTVYEEKLYLFLFMNSRISGGFDKMAMNARIDDGQMDFIGIKEMGINMLPTVFSKILQGEHLEDPNILHFQSDWLKIDCLTELNELKNTDIDGEEGPPFPLEIQVYPKRIRLFY